MVDLRRSFKGDEPAQVQEAVEAAVQLEEMALKGSKRPEFLEVFYLQDQDATSEHAIYVFFFSKKPFSNQLT